MRIKLTLLSVGLLLLFLLALFRAGISPEQSAAIPDRSFAKTKTTKSAESIASVDSDAQPAEPSPAAKDHVPGEPGFVMSEQKQLLLASSELMDEKVVAVPSGFKKSRLLKSKFKYPFLQRDIFTDKNGNFLRDEIFVSDHALVKFPPSVSEEEIRTWSGNAGFKIRKKLKTDSIYLVATSGQQLFDADKLIKEFETDFGEGGLPVVEGVAEKDYVYTTQTIPNEPEFAELWGMNNTGQTGGTADADIDAAEVWDLTTGSREVLVAVIDTGVDITHPDLAPNIWVNANEVPDNNFDDDGNGFIDDVTGWNFYENNSSPLDDNNHGTHCSGTVGAVGNNGSGVAGVAWEVSIMPIRFLGPYGGATSDAIDSINYTTNAGVNITSNSWGGGGYSSLLEFTIQQAGENDILFVAAAGNNQQDIDGVFTYYPSGYDVETVITVAGTTHTDSLSTFSNFGATSVDLGAPGTGIYSTKVDGYGSLSGTSMATPHVTGVLSLMKAVAPELSALELKEALLDTTDEVVALDGISLTGGRLNAERAVSLLRESRLRFNGFDIEFTSGNGDEHINPGETGNFVFTLINGGSKTSVNGVATITPNTVTTDVTLGTNEIAVGDLEPGEETPELRIPFVVASTAPTPEVITYTLETTDEDGNVNTSEYFFSIYTSATISGRIFHSGNLTSIEGATISATGPVSVDAVSDPDGNYTLYVVDGSYDIVVNAEGYFTSDEIEQTVPPSVEGLDVGLGLPAMSITPESIYEEVFSGTFEGVPLTLTNTGTVPIEWSLIAKGSLTTNEALLLEETTFDLRSEEGEEQSMVAAAVNVQNLSGAKILLLSTSSSLLEADLLVAEAEVTQQSSLPQNFSIDTVDVLVVDDAVGGLTAGEVTKIRDWVHEGGGLLVTGDSSQENNNALLQDSGIETVSAGEYLSETITDITLDSLTEGVNSVTLSGYGTTGNVSDPAISLMRNADGETVLASSRLGFGSVVYMANELDNSSGGEGRLLANNIVSELGGNANWLYASAVSGVVPTGETTMVNLTLNARNRVGGIYEGEVVITSNELADGVHIIPVTMEVIGAALISTNVSSHDFGSVFEGGTYVHPITISNAGTDTLEITAANFSNPDFGIDASLPLSIPPRSHTVVNLNFQATSLGSISSTLTLVNNSVLDPSLEIALTAEVETPPVIGVTPASVDATLASDGVHSEMLTISNSGGASLDWDLQIVHTGGSVAGSLESVLEDINENVSEITNLIPNRYDFSEGETGASIGDGGNDMYDGGNILSTEGSEGLDYSNQSVAVSTDFGTNGRYFTGKWNGLFVMGADLDGVDRFAISGGLGADGSGSVETSEVTTFFKGSDYTGYIKRVFGAGDPSVNHLIIVPSDANISQSASNNTDSDEHILTGLGGTERLYYLLFASEDGGYVDDATMLGIMEAFMQKAPGGGQWISLATTGGSVDPGDTDNVELTLSANLLPAGEYQAEVRVSSNAPLTPVVTVPIQLEVTSSPSIATNASALDFGDVYMGGSGTVPLVISNSGNGPLTIDSATFSNSTFSIVEPFPISVDAWSEMTVQVKFSPSVSGVVSGMLSLENDSEALPNYEISLTGEGIAPPVIEVSPGSIQVTLDPNESLIESFMISNSGSNVLQWWYSGIHLTSGEVQFSKIERTLERLHDHIDEIANLIPNRFDFNEGISGATISDGGDDMYDEGNALSTNFAQSIVYSDDVVVDSGSFGIAGRYFTKKVDGLFVLGAELDGVDQFAISGNLGADGSGLTDTSSVTTTHAGRGYTGYVKRVYGTNDPSVNHLIIIPSDDAVQQSASADTDNDEHSLTGLGSVDALYYLLFASEDGGYVDDNVMLDILEAFLENSGSSGWFDILSEPESVDVLSSQNVEVEFHSADLLAGVYEAEVFVQSNDPQTPEVLIPLSLTVTSAPAIAATPTIAHFGDVYVGTTAMASVVISNRGNDVLQIDSASFSHGEFGVVEAFPISIDAGSEVTLTMSYAPSSPGAVSGTLTLTNNSLLNPNYEIELAGNAVTPPVLDVSPGSFEVTMSQSETLTESLTISNPGGDTLNWSLVVQSTDVTDWLSVPASGTINPGSFQNIDVAFQSSDYPTGAYQAALVISSNATVASSMTIPVVMNVTSHPLISVDEMIYEIENMYPGESYEVPIVISNNGNDVLQITSSSFSNAEVSIAETFPIYIEAGGQLTLTVTVNPSSLGDFSETVTLTSNSASTPDVEITFTGNVVVPPVIEVSPQSLHALMLPNQTLVQPLTIANSGQDTLEWTISIRSPGFGVGGNVHSLEDSLAELNQNFARITEQMPERFDFIDGVTGTYILDGGGDMFDGGNILSTDLESPVSYSDDVVIQSTAFGVNGRYYTRKVEGLFVLAADLDGVDRYEITGNIGADGAGTTDTSVITLAGDGKDYTGYVKRVYGAGDPSINHLIIVESDAGITQTANLDTQNDEHSLAGLAGTTRLYHLLFASENGGYIGDAVMLEIMDAFLRNTSTTTWLAASISNGETPLQTSEVVEMTFSSDGIDAGIFETEVVLTSNDPLAPEVIVPVTMEIYEFPQDLYEQWKIEQLGGGDSANSGFAEDWNGDGITNGQEFFFAMDPNVSPQDHDHLPTLEMTPAGPKVIYTRSSALSDVMLMWQQSPDMEQWRMLDHVPAPAGIDQGNGTTQTEFLLDDLSEARRFFRFGVWSGQ